MNDKYEIPTLSIDDLNDLKLSDTLTTIDPLSYDSITIGVSGSNGTSASDIQWQGNSGVYTHTAIPNVVLGTGTSYNWTSTPTWTTTGTNIQPSGKITLQGEDADVDINGKSLKTWMEKVEERLNILTPNPELEKDWDDLRKLGERYRKLEKRCKEKAEAWNKLKSMPPPKMD